VEWAIVALLDAVVQQGYSALFGDYPRVMLIAKGPKPPSSG